MKNFLIGALVFALLSFSAVKTELSTVKPAIPKSTVTFYSKGANSTANKINYYSKKGYVVKEISSIYYSGFDSIVVMEKY